MDPLRYQLLQSGQAAEALTGGPIPHRCDSFNSEFRFAILRDQPCYHVYWVLACQSLGFDFEVVDIESPTWLHDTDWRAFDAVLAWPAPIVPVWKILWEDRLRILVEHVGVRLVPRLDELWLLDSKRRVADWLAARGIPAPRTTTLLNRDQALAFVANADYPLVCKTDGGAASSGVFILKKQAQAVRLVKKAFGRGLRRRRGHRHDRERGFVIFQEYIRHDHEWRIVRIGPNFLCRRKVRIGDFASASGAIDWAHPPVEMLDFVRAITDRGGFQSMAVDLFENPDGPEGAGFLVNELQCLFGAIKKANLSNPDMGRWTFDGDGVGWSFEPGYFYDNACANLRLHTLVETLRSERLSIMSDEDNLIGLE